MPGLLDIADLCETVQVGPKHIPLAVHAISARDLVPLLQKYPELRKMMTGQEQDSMTADRIFEMIPEAIDSILMSATDQPVEIVRAIGLQDQAEILAKVWDLTFTKGLPNFLKALEVMAGELAGVRGNTPVMKSPEPSNSASPVVTTPQQHGDTAQGN